MATQKKPFTAEQVSVLIEILGRQHHFLASQNVYFYTAPAWKFEKKEGHESNISKDEN